MKELVWVLGAVCAIIFVLYRAITGRSRGDAQRAEELIERLKQKAREIGPVSEAAVDRAIKERREEIARELEGRSPEDVIADLLRTLPPGNGSGYVGTHGD